MSDEDHIMWSMSPSGKREDQDARNDQGGRVQDQNAESVQSNESSWRRIVLQHYPDLKERTYFIPPMRTKRIPVELFTSACVARPGERNSTAKYKKKPRVSLGKTARHPWNTSQMATVNPGVSQSRSIPAKMRSANEKSRIVPQGAIEKSRIVPQDAIEESCIIPHCAIEKSIIPQGAIEKSRIVHEGAIEKSRIVPQSAIEKSRIVPQGAEGDRAQSGPPHSALSWSNYPSTLFTNEPETYGSFENIRYFVSADIALQKVVHDLRTLAEKSNEMMAVYFLPSSETIGAFSYRSINIISREEDEKDVQIVHKQHGLIMGEMRCVNECMNNLQDQDAIMAKTVKEAVLKLRDSETALRCLGFLRDINITKTLILPNVTSKQLIHALKADYQLQKDLCVCLGASTFYQAIDLCLTLDRLPSLYFCGISDDKNHLQTELEVWWHRLVRKTRNSIAMSTTEYENIVTMLFGPAFLTVQPKNTQSVAMGYTERLGEIPEDTELEALKDQKRNEIFDVSNASSVAQIHSFRRDRNYPKPVFCEDWQTSKLFSSDGGLLQRQQSDVILYIPDNALEESDEVIIKGAVCTDLKTVHLALALDNTETIVSPVAEFCTDQNQEFKVPVWIYLPHFIPSVHLSECVTVYHFHKNETGSIKVVKLQQKSLTKMRKSPRDTDRNDYFYFTENHHICINTCHFSGFVCTCTHELKPVPLDLHLYGVHRQRRRREVHISLYVWDGRLRIKDFEKEIVIGQEAELKLITAHRLDPVENNSEVELGALVELSEEDEEVWMHSEIRNRQKFPVEARRKLENIFVCQARPLQAYVRAECPSQGEQVDEFCCYDRKPLRIDWELRNKPGCIPDVWFDSAVLVGYVKNVEKNINFLDNPRHLVLNVAGLKLETQPDKTTQTDIDTAQETYVKKLSEPVRAPSFSSTEDDLRGYCSNININIGNITGEMSLSNVSGTQTGRELQPEQKFKSTGLCPVMSTEETTCKIANSPLKDEFEANFTTMNVTTARSPLDERSTVISSQTQEPAGQEEELGAVGGSSPEIFESRGTPEEFYVNSNENRTCKRSNLPTSNNVFKTGIRSTDASNRGVNTTGPKRTRVSCKGIDCFVENSRTSQANEETLNPNPECVNQENHLRTLLRNEILKPPVQCEDSLRPTTETHE